MLWFCSFYDQMTGALTVDYYSVAFCTPPTLHVVNAICLTDNGPPFNGGTNPQTNCVNPWFDWFIAQKGATKTKCQILTV